MSFNQSKHSCGNVHSYDPNKVKELLLVTKCLFERLIKDVSQYVKELSKFQDYYQRYDVVYDPNMYPVMLNRLTETLTLFYVAFKNHLATKTNVRGVGEQIIKPPWCDADNNIIASTTIKYQNVIKMCNDCQKCRNSNKSSFQCGCNENSYTSIKDHLKVQSTINVATYDNVNISTPSTMTSDGSASECTINVGNLSYVLANFPSSLLCSPSEISVLYTHVDKQIKILSSLENALETNVGYINKYLNKFLV
jgi:hypothetical protein